MGVGREGCYAVKVVQKGKWAEIIWVPAHATIHRYRTIAFGGGDIVNDCGDGAGLEWTRGVRFGGGMWNNSGLLGLLLFFGRGQTAKE